MKRLRTMTFAPVAGLAAAAMLISACGSSSSSSGGGGSSRGGALAVAGRAHRALAR